MKLFVLMSSNRTKHWGVINIKNMWTQMPIQICIVIFQSRNHEKMGSSQAEVWTSMYKKLCDSLFLNSSSAKAPSFQPFTCVWWHFVEMPGRPRVLALCSTDVILSSSSNSFLTICGLQEILQDSTSVALLFSGRGMWMGTVI